MKRDFLRIGFDLDGVIFEETPEVKCWETKANPKIVELIQKLRRTHVVILYTSRPYSLLEKTQAQLLKANILYDHLVMGKPSFDILIDDRAMACPTNVSTCLVSALEESLEQRIEERMEMPRWVKEGDQ